MIQGRREPLHNHARKPLRYHDFAIRFSQYDQSSSTFKVWVEGETPGGSMRPNDASLCAYTSTDFWSDPISKKGGTLDRLERRKLNAGEMYALGCLLANIALPEGTVRNLFQRSLAALAVDEGLRIRLHLDPLVLVQLPWEFMALPQVTGEPKPTDFLALRREISLVRTDSVESAICPLRGQNQLRVVGVFSSPTDLPSLAVEKDKLALQESLEMFQKAVGQKVISTIWVEDPATRLALEQALLDGADIFHFAGHAMFDAQIRQEGFIVLEREDYSSERYSGERLAQLLRNAGVRLVILGACETGRRNDQRMWNGLAPALTREKIPAVLAHQFDIYDANAALVAERVYQRIMTGYTIDEAVFEARQAIYQRKGLENRDWGAPVLYLHDKAGILFPIPEEDASESGQSIPFIQVVNAFKKVSGDVIDVKLHKMKRGHISINDSVDIIDENGTFTSLEIDELT